MRRVLLCMASLLSAACGSQSAAPDYTAMVLDRHGHRLERVGDRLIAFGGFAAAGGAPERGMRQTLTFELPAGPWRACAPMPAAHAFFGSGVLTEQIYAVGSTIERYQASRDRWLELPVAVPLPKSHFATATHGGRIHMLGGYPTAVSGHHAFDPATGAVETLAPPPGFEPGDHFHLLASLDGRLHAVGGLREGGSTLSRAHHAFDGKAWTERAAPPTELWAKFAAACAIHDTLYVFSRESSVAYDAKADRWRAVSSIPVPLVMPATAVLRGRIVVIGGRPLEDRPYAVQVYDPRSDVWTTHRRTAP